MSNNQLTTEVQERIVNNALKYAASSGNEMIARLGYIAGATAENSRAQELINALEEIERRIKVGKAGASYQIEMIRPIVNKALQQWKEGKEAPEKFTQFALECAITAIPLSVLKSDGEYFKAGNGKQFVAFRWDKDENNARLSIREDGDTRYVFNGLVTSVDDFKKAWELTVLIN